MPNAVLLKSAQTVTNKRLRKLGHDRLLNGATILLFDTKPALYPAQDANFGGISEGVSGRSVTYAKGGGTAATFTGNMLAFSAGTAGAAGLTFGLSSDAGIDLFARAGSTRFLLVEWVRFAAIWNNFVVPIFYNGQGGVAITSPQSQLMLDYVNPGLRVYVAGQQYSIPFTPTLGTTYQIAVVADLNAATNVTTVTVYIATNAARPTKAGTFTASYIALAAITNGGASLGIPAGLSPAATSAPSNIAVGRLLLEDVTQSLRDAERQIFLDWEQNAGRFA